MLCCSRLLQCSPGEYWHKTRGLYLAQRERNLRSSCIGCPMLGFISTSREIHSLLGGMQVSMMRSLTWLPCFSSCDSFLTVSVPCSCDVSPWLWGSAGCSWHVNNSGLDRFIDFFALEWCGTFHLMTKKFSCSSLSTFASPVTTKALVWPWYGRACTPSSNVLLNVYLLLSD